MENVTENDIHELVDAHRHAYIQGRDKFGDGSIQFRILQAILRVSAENTYRWINLNTSSTPASCQELQSYAETIAKGDIIGTAASKVTPSAALTHGIRAAVRAAAHHVVIWAILLVVANVIVWSGAMAGRFVVHAMLAGGAIAGITFVVLRGLASRAPEAGKAAVNSVKSARQFSGPAQCIFESQTTPTLTRFYGRFNRPTPRTPLCVWVNRTATGTLVLMYLVLAVAALFFVIGVMHSIAG
jgi:hypothetical protein